MTTLVPNAQYVREDDSGFFVRSAAYVDEKMFSREMTRIFESSWVYVGHESEIPHSGDFITTWLGRQSIILSRTKSGDIAGLINACRHRGYAVCRERSGNTASFRCPYHGWTYATDGKLVGVTSREQYPASIISDIGGLEKVPMVDTYRGLIFASLSADVSPLAEHLAPVRHQIDLWADASPDAEYVVRRPHLFEYPGNWKLQVENTVDGYHPRFLHESGIKALSLSVEPVNGSDGTGVAPRDLRDMFSVEVGCTRGFERGHATLERPPAHDEPVVGIAKFPTHLYAAYMKQLITLHGEARAEELRVNRHVYVFPNLFLMDVNIRVVHPIAVNKTEVASYFVEAPGVDPEVNVHRLADLQRRLAPSGLVGPDDMEVFAGNQTAMETGRPEWLLLSRGLQAEARGEHGEAVGTYSSETSQRAFWRHWANVVDSIEDRA